LVESGIIKIPQIRKSLDDLEALCHKAIDANDEFRIYVKAVAKAAGIDHTVLGAYVKARVADKLDAQRAKAEQLSLLFDEIG
jgi:hypothetical protein